jgi:hypothetical protein
MVTAEIIGEKLVVTMHGSDVIWSCMKQLEIPLSHIKDIRVDERPSFPKDGFVWRMGGTALPGLIIAGHYLCAGKWYFWNVKSGHPAVVIDIQGQKFSQIVLSIENPTSFAKELKSEIASGAVAV